MKKQIPINKPKSVTSSAANRCRAAMPVLMLALLVVSLLSSGTALGTERTLSWSWMIIFRLVDLESAAEREMAVHDHARHIAGPQLRRSSAAKIGLEGDVVNKISRELETIAKDHHATTQDAQLDDFIPEPISKSDPQLEEISLGDFHLSGEAIVGGTSFIVQTRLPAGIHSNHRLEARFEANA
jgi:hypothetical protein